MTQGPEREERGEKDPDLILCQADIPLSSLEKGGTRQRQGGKVCPAGEVLGLDKHVSWDPSIDTVRGYSSCVSIRTTITTRHDDAATTSCEENGEFSLSILFQKPLTVVVVLVPTCTNAAAKLSSSYPHHRRKRTTLPVSECPRRRLSSCKVWEPPSTT